MLKRILPMLIAFSLVSLVSSAQFVSVPDVAVKAFDQKFPDAKQVKWLHNIGKPEVEFVQNEKKCKARFTSKGVWEETEIKITEADLPTEVSDGFHKSKYNDWPVKEVSKFERPGGVRYKIAVSKGSLNSKSLYFNEKGVLQKDS